MSYPCMLWHPQIAFSRAGVIGAPNDTALQNPAGSPMLIDEIRFSTSALGPVYGTMMVRIRLGQYDLTQNFVPISLIGQQVAGGAGPLGVWGLQNTPNLFLQRELYSWKLAKPLYIPGSEKLVVSYLAGQGTRLDDIATAYPPNIRMGIYGTVLEGDDIKKIPKKNAIPWVAYWKSNDRTVVVPGAGAAPAIGNLVENSSRSNLVNPFDQDLFVERFMGAIAIQNSQTVDAGTVTNAWTDAGNFLTGAANATLGNSDYIVRQIISKYITVQMTNSDGDACVRTPVPFDHIFSRLDKSWPCGVTVRPKAFFHVRLNENFASLNVGTVANPVAAQTVVVRPMITMVGYRELEMV